MFYAYKLYMFIPGNLLSIITRNLIKDSPFILIVLKVLVSNLNPIIPHELFFLKKIDI